MAKAYLVLADGTVFQGESFGASMDGIGELVFNTGIVGYIETLTDPSYYGQIVMQTFPLIGNYGIIEEDFEGDCCIKGYVVREWCPTPSNFRSQYDLDTFLKDRGVPGLCGVDTRAIAQHIRNYGVMNAMICAQVPEDLSQIRGYAVRDAVRSVTTGSIETYPAEGCKRANVTVLDFGAKHNIVRELQKRGCEVKVMPASTPAECILADHPDGVMLSNGPGDPAENTEIIAEIRKVLGNVPMFGICLGHQLMALAAGAQTTKLKFGHRGVNQPATDLKTGRTYPTSQNHGYAVVSESIVAGQVSWVNANDGSCEGIDYPEWNACSVQFHPEACPGTWDTRILFDRFMDMLNLR